MKINIIRLKNAPGETIEFDVAKELDNTDYNGQEIGFKGPVQATGQVTNHGNVFTVKGLVRAKVFTNCVNCLELFEGEVTAQLEESYSMTEVKASEQESEVLVFSGDIIDIEPEVIKALVMEMPMRLLCSLNCRGLCPQCGTNLNLDRCGCQGDNIDPRLAILKKLQQ